MRTVTRDDVYLQEMKPVGRCIMSVIDAVQRYPLSAQVVAAACLMSLVMRNGLVRDLSVPELMTLGDRLIDSRDERGVNGAEAYMKNHVGGSL